MRECKGFPADASAAQLPLRVVATDSNERQLQPFYPVELQTADAALTKYTPAVVLVSWMELGQDWTDLFRQCESVQEYRWLLLNPLPPRSITCY